MAEATPPHRDPETLATRWTQIGNLHGRGSEAAWQWFVGRYRPFVRGILGRSLTRATEADAAEQEFWGYVWMSGALLRAERGRRFRAFLSGIVRNFAHGFARSHSGQRGAGLADLELDQLPAADDTTELRMWLDNVVANALATLRDESPSTATAIISFYGLAGDGAAVRPRSASEVATELGNTTQAVYMLLFRGRRRLRELIEFEVREGCGDETAWREEMQALLGAAATRLPGLLGDG